MANNYKSYGTYMYFRTTCPGQFVHAQTEVISMRFDLLHPADQLVMIMDAHLPLRHDHHVGRQPVHHETSNGDIWITPSGIDKGNR